MAFLSFVSFIMVSKTHSFSVASLEKFCMHLNILSEANTQIFAVHIS